MVGLSSVLSRRVAEGSRPDVLVSTVEDTDDVVDRLLVYVQRRIAGLKEYV